MSEDELFAKMAYMNRLSPYFRTFDQIAHITMTKGLKTEQEYNETIEVLGAMANDAQYLISEIPTDVDMAFREDVKDFLTVIKASLENIQERTEHLKNKSFYGEKYTFTQDRQYIKQNSEYDKQIAKIGLKINRHRDAITRAGNMIMEKE